jgi:hypothetical protein
MLHRFWNFGYHYPRNIYQPMSNTSRTLFISYKREPVSQALVQQISSFIEIEFDDLSVVFDEKGVPTGGDIRDYMEQLTQGDYIIFLIGPEFLESQWCMFELALAANSGNFKARMFPIILPGTDLNYDLVWEHVDRWTSEWEKQIERIEKQFDRNPKTVTPSMFDRRDVLEQISIGCSTALDIVLRTKWLEVDWEGALDFERLKSFMRKWIVQNRNTPSPQTNAKPQFPPPIQQLLDDMLPIPTTTITLEIAAYQLGRTPVTQAQWQAVMGTNPSHFQSADAPVESVNWHDCQAFLTQLNALTGRQFRLPTEAEWVHAASATMTPAPALATIAVFDQNAHWQSQPVGTHPGNAFGLQDMLGNVFEWCQDLDTAADASQEDVRVIKGGAWLSHAADLDPRTQHTELATTHHPAIGLRLAHNA